MPSTVQMNIRVEAEVKHQAEEVMYLMGGSLADLVRAMLVKVARGARDAEEVQRAIDSGPEANEGTKASKVQQCLDHIDRRHTEMAEMLGVDLSTFEPMTDEEYEEALYDYHLEREHERMVWHE